MDKKIINSENPCYERLAGGGQPLNNFNKAFTLAETMIVLVILGVIASITIPALVRNQMDAQNRTRLRKAMTVYDMVLNKMVVENGIKSNDALINEFNADHNNNSCAKSRAYFKSAQDGVNDCTFRASDGLWWNIEDITHPIIAFNENDLTAEKAAGNTNETFYLVGYLDNNGLLRVSDIASADDDNQEYLTKLYNFANNVKSNAAGGNNAEEENDSSEYVLGETPLNIDWDAILEKYNSIRSNECTDKNVSCCKREYSKYYCYDENGFLFHVEGSNADTYNYFEKDGFLIEQSNYYGDEKYYTIYKDEAALNCDSKYTNCKCMWNTSYQGCPEGLLDACSSVGYTSCAIEDGSNENDYNACTCTK